MAERCSVGCSVRFEWSFTLVLSLKWIGRFALKQHALEELYSIYESSVWRTVCPKCKSSRLMNCHPKSLPAVLLDWIVMNECIVLIESQDSKEKRDEGSTTLGQWLSLASLKHAHRSGTGTDHAHRTTQYLGVYSATYILLHLQHYVASPSLCVFNRPPAGERVIANAGPPVSDDQLGMYLPSSSSSACCSATMYSEATAVGRAYIWAIVARRAAVWACGGREESICVCIHSDT